MATRKNFLAAILLDALDDGNERDVFKIVDEYDVDASYIPGDYGISPLHYACGTDNLELGLKATKIFLEKGADPNVLSDEKMTPLHVAAIYGRDEITKLLLEYGARTDIADENRKTPVHYAVEEYHFGVFELLRSQIYKNKCKKKLEQQKEKERANRFEIDKENSNSISINDNDSKENNNYNPNSTFIINSRLKVPTEIQNSSAGKTATDNLYYNNDPTSPYYINITHRRHQRQPKFPVDMNYNVENPNVETVEEPRTSLASKRLVYGTPVKNIVNIFNLTVENLDEFSRQTRNDVQTNLCIINTWREKVKQSRERNSLILNSDIDNNEEIINKNYNDDNEVEKEEINTKENSNSNNSRVPKVNLMPATPKSTVENNDEYIVQMTEAYVHTDDENGLVFYEKRLLGDPKNQTKAEEQQQNVAEMQKLELNVPASNLNNTCTTQSTNITLPVDYETDNLRTELKSFGDIPGPITKDTKRLYLKRLLKYKRNTEKMIGRLDAKNEQKFSVELCRTLRNTENFQDISKYLKYDQESSEYFVKRLDIHKMREGHRKQSFIYMLIDPRISCNLPAENLFMNELDVWKRFLSSIFYVGKGKSSRPYSHLYEAMKLHSRLHNKENVESNEDKCLKKTFKKSTLNFDVFKLPHEVIVDNKKLERILEIWGDSCGVVCLHLFHNIMPIEAYTREAAMIAAMGLDHLTNIKRGDFYGPAKMWTMKEKKYLGIALLYKAMRIYLAEGESQLSPSDLI